MNTLTATKHHTTIPTHQRATPRPTPNLVNEDWRDYAVCGQDTNPDRWVDLPPVRKRGKNNPAYDVAVNELTAVCNTCPVRDTCLAFGLASSMRGVVGGMDEYERADTREALGLPTPPMIPAAENDDDARLIEQQFTALRLARQGLTNRQIATTMGISAMSVSRLTASEERPAKRRSRKG